MRPGSDRWHEVSPSEFAHERAGLEHVRDLLPDRGPFHAWSNFEFRDRQGKWSEVDLLVLGEGRLHLVELKHYRGRLGGNAYRWQRGNRSEDSPLILARRKAQRLSSELKEAAKRLALPPERVPFVQESVFLHAEDFTCLLSRADQADLFGLDGHEDKSLLPSVADRLLEPDRGRHDRQPLKEDDLLRVVEEAGFAVQRQREVGSWRITGSPLAEGEGWQDWPAEQRMAHDPARIRFFLVPEGASNAQLEGRRKLVAREYLLTQRLRHDGVQSPRDLVEHELGAGLVFPFDKDDQRLDLWVADQLGELALTEQIELVRQLAEALQYAHSNGVVHRGLTPIAVSVRTTRNGPQLLIGDWQVAGASDDAGDSVLATQGSATRIFGALDSRGRAHSGERAADAYVAPEGQWSQDAHRVKLDVFALGALTYLVLTGRPPAANATELKQRLAREQGLDLAADLPEASKALRDLVLAATNPRVSDRLRDTTAFLERLSEAERAAAAGLGDTVIDPLDAPPGTLLGDRFELVRRLGSGSTAVGLLVIDQQADGAHRVLKVARDDSAAQRLTSEARVLSALAPKKHPRLVRILETDPIRVGDRAALLLESAGEETLADILRDRRRLSLDLLERWGLDLLDALVGLDQAGVDHRDIKPANLGVREQRSDRAKHLVLFDFSLSGASAASLEAGTPPYLDPFLGTGTRTHWDSAAERYAVAVTLFEMATGHAPVYGDGASDPATIPDQATVEAADFDPTLSGALVPFFTQALARDAKQRFGTATEMLAAWRTALAITATTDVDEADDLANLAKIDTHLTQSGLTPRALSALEPFHVSTVGDLAALDTSQLRRFTGVVDATKREIRARAKQWREKFSDTLPEARPDQDVGRSGLKDPLSSPEATARLLVDAAGGPRATAKRSGAAILLGLEGEAPAFGTLAELAGPFGLGGQPQVSQLLSGIRDTWAASPTVAAILDDLFQRATDAVQDLDGVAWADHVTGALVADGADQRTIRVMSGLIRAALDRADDKAKGADEESVLTRRRRRADNRLLLATSVELASAGGRLGILADELVTQTVSGGETVVAHGRSVPALRREWPSDLPALDDVRLLRLAARMSDRAAASTQGELYARDMAPDEAVRRAFGATIAGQRLTVEDIRRFVSVRFPGLADLPARPDLDDVLRRAGTGLEWAGDAYAVPSAHSDTTFVTQTRLTGIPVSNIGQAESREIKELRESVRACSFLALGIPGRRAEAVATQLRDHFGGVEVNVTDLLLEALRAKADEVGLSWNDVVAADAAEPNSRPAQGLAALVAQSIPMIEVIIEEAMTSAPEATRPVLITDAAPLARYGHMALLPRLADVTRRRTNAVWLIVPQGSEAGPLLDGQTIQLSYGSQFVKLDGALVTAPHISTTERDT